MGGGVQGEPGSAWSLPPAARLADPGAPYWAPPLAKGHAQAICRPPRRLRVAICDTTLTGEPIHPEVAEAVRSAGRVLEMLGHHVEPLRPKADVAMMMRAWTDIVALGTALSIRSKIGDRSPREDEIEGVGRGAWAHAQRLHPTRYLEAVGEIHAFGRQMAGFFDGGPDILLTATLSEPPAEVGRFAHATEDYLAYRIGPEGIFAYSPFCAVFNASGQPAASLPLGWSTDGLPVGIHLAAAFGQDELLIALCAEVERAVPWASKRAPMAG